MHRFCLEDGGGHRAGKISSLMGSRAAPSSHSQRRKGTPVLQLQQLNSITGRMFELGSGFWPTEP